MELKQPYTKRQGRRKSSQSYQRGIETRIKNSTKSIKTGSLNRTNVELKRDLVSCLPDLDCFSQSYQRGIETDLSRRADSCTHSPLNRTNLELKQMKKEPVTTVYLTLNRTSMELKLHSACNDNIVPIAFNRTIVELKQKYET